MRRRLLPPNLAAGLVGLLGIIGCGALLEARAAPTAPLTTSTAPAPRAIGHPRTIVTAKPREQIFNIGRDGNRIAWMAGVYDGSCADINVRGLTSGRDVRMVRICGEPSGHGNGERFAFAGDRALWLMAEGGNDITFYVQTASLADRRQRTVETIPPDYSPYYPVYAMAGHGGILAYETSTRTRFLRDGRSWPLPGHPHPTGLPVLGGSAIAIVHGTPDQDAVPTRRPGPVDVIRVADGSLVSQISPEEIILDAALASGRLALLVMLRRQTPDVRVYVYDVESGKRRWSARVWYRTQHIAMDRNTLVYEAQGRLHAINAVSGRGRVVARIHEEPLALSIEGGRVVWGEISRIRVLQLAAG